MDQEEFKKMAKGTILEELMAVDLTDIRKHEKRVEKKNAVIIAEDARNSFPPGYNYPGSPFEQ